MMEKQQYVGGDLSRGFSPDVLSPWPRGERVGMLHGTQFQPLVHTKWKHFHSNQEAEDFDHIYHQRRASELKATGLRGAMQRCRIFIYHARTPSRAC